MGGGNEQLKVEMHASGTTLAILSLLLSLRTESHNFFFFFFFFISINTALGHFPIDVSYRSSSISDGGEASSLYFFFLGIAKRLFVMRIAPCQTTLDYNSVGSSWIWRRMSIFRHYLAEIACWPRLFCFFPSAYRFFWS